MLKVRKLSPELAKKAEKELNENEAALQAGIQYLKEWLKSQPHINEYLDDQWLAVFLRGCKYSLERAQKKLENYYTAKTLLPEIYKNRDPSIDSTKYFIESGNILTLENKTDPAGPTIVFVCINYDINKYNNIDEFFKYSFSVLDIMLYEQDNASISGFVEVCDLKYLTFRHLLPYTPNAARKSTKLFTECYPVRLKGMHFLNPPPGFEVAFNLLKYFMPKKLKSRLYIHSNIESVFEYIPKENFPKEYGGEAETISELTAKWASKFESRKDFLIDSEKYCTDEQLRPNGPIRRDSYNFCSVM